MNNSFERKDDEVGITENLLSGCFSKKPLKILSHKDSISDGFATQVPETGTRRWMYLQISVNVRNQF